MAVEGINFAEKSETNRASARRQCLVERDGEHRVDASCRLLAESAFWPAAGDGPQSPRTSHSGRLGTLSAFGDQLASQNDRRLGESCRWSAHHLRCKTATMILVASNPSARSRFAETEDVSRPMVVSGILAIAARMMTWRSSGCMVNCRCGRGSFRPELVAD